MKTSIETRQDQVNYINMLRLVYLDKLKSGEMGNFYHRSSQKRIDKWVEKTLQEDVLKNGIPEENNLEDYFEERFGKPKITLYWIPNYGLTTGIEPSLSRGIHMGLPPLDEALFEEVSYADFYNNAKETNMEEKHYVCRELDGEMQKLLVAKYGLSDIYLDAKLEMHMMLDYANDLQEREKAFETLFAEGKITEERYLEGKAECQENWKSLINTVKRD
jgi:hypothetical protein